MTNVWVGYTEGGEQGYDMFTSPPLVAFDNEPAAKKWKTLGNERQIDKLTIESKSECDKCGSKLN